MCHSSEALASYQLSRGGACVARGVVASVVIVVIIFIFLDLLIGSFHRLLLFYRVIRTAKHPHIINITKFCS